MGISRGDMVTTDRLRGPIWEQTMDALQCERMDLHRLRHCIPICVVCVVFSIVWMRYALVKYMAEWINSPPIEGQQLQWYTAEPSARKIYNVLELGDRNSTFTRDFKPPETISKPMLVGISNAFSLVGEVGQIHYGDIVSFMINLNRAKSRGRVATTGGDFWYATMSSPDRHFRTAGRLVDYSNGSYSVYFYAGNHGYMNINITRVYSGEAVQWLDTVYRHSERRVTWNGYFREGKIGGETTQCVVVRNVSSSKDTCCEYRHPTVLGETVVKCVKPKQLSCSDLTYMQSDNIAARTNELLGNRRELFDKNTIFTQIEGSPSVIHISASITSAIETLLPKCVIASNHSSVPVRISGYWLGDIWHSLTCRNEQHSVEMVQRCLQNKQIYFLGDSTIRQLYLSLVGALGYQGSVSDPHQELQNITGSYTVHQDIMNMYHATTRQHEHNVNITFQFHGLPITGRAKFRVKEPGADVKFEPYVIDELSTERCNYIVLVSPWAHYVQWTLASYIERLMLLRESLLRLHERCSNTVIIVKGSHQRDHRSVDSHIFASDWILYDMNRILREIFYDDFILFLDVWDMNLSYLAPWNTPSNVHMPYSVIKQELNLLLSYVCQ
ncbi:NXPE family member 4-like [Saccoglossus kowalevskii]